MTSCAFLFIGNGMISRMLSSPARQHDHAVYARGDTCMRRSSVAECVVHSRELGLHVVLAQTNDLEGLYHDLGIVVTNGTGGELYTVADQIVLVSGDGQGILDCSVHPDRPGAWRTGCGRTPSSPDSSPISYIGKSTIQQNS